MSKAYMEVHVIVIWPWAKRQKKIERYIKDNFFVLDRFMPANWVDKEEELGAFYGFDDPVKYPGELPPLVYVVRSLADRAARPTSTGMELVNPHLFDAKMKLRKWGGKHGRLNSVHASDTQEEALINLKRLVPRYPDFETLLSRIPGKYVILRNFEGEPDHGDVDILVENLEGVIAVTGAVRVDAYSNFTDTEQKDLKNKYLVLVGDRLAVLDFRYVGDNYLDRQWQREILDQRQKRGILYGPSDDHWYWTLLYHALIHKGDLNQYRETLERVRPRASHTRETLIRMMKIRGYKFTQPDDPLLSLFGVILGEVVDGRGWAGINPQDGLQEQWETACDFTPYPGTLNIRIDGTFVMPKPKQSSAIAVMTPDGETYTPLYFWDAFINGYPCVLSGGGNLPGQVEVLADVHLRTELKLETGDRVEVIVK